MSGYFLRLLARASGGAGEAEATLESGEELGLPPALGNVGAVRDGIDRSEPLSAAGQPKRKATTAVRPSDAAVRPSDNAVPIGEAVARSRERVASGERAPRDDAPPREIVPDRAVARDVERAAAPAAGTRLFDDRVTASAPSLWGSAVHAMKETSPSGATARPHATHAGQQAGKTPGPVLAPPPLLPTRVARLPSATMAATAPPIATRGPTTDTAPSVHISIGRIEVIAAPPPSAAAPRPAPPPTHAPQSLDAYLAQRARAR